MTEKDKDSQRKTKSGSTSRSTTGKAKSQRKTAAKPAARAKATPAAKKKATAEKPADKKPPTARTRARRVKPGGAEAIETTVEAADEQSAATTGGATLLQDVHGQLPSGASRGSQVLDDTGESALAEWASASPERRPRLSSRAPTRPRSPENRNLAPSADAPTTRNELLDVPAWPELSDEPFVSAPRPEPEPLESEESWVVDETSADEDAFEPAELDYEPEEPAEELQAEPDELANDERLPAGQASDLPAGEEQPPRSKRRRRRRRGRNRNRQAEDANGDSAPAQTDRHPAPAQGDRRPAPAQGDRRPTPAQGDRRPPPDQRRGGPAKPADGRKGPAAPRPVKDEPLEDELEPIDVAEELWDTEIVEEEGEALPPPDEKNGRLMLINVAEGEECRIAILHQKRLEELFIERASAESHVGNIYKGKVTNVEPSIQAAFVDFGLPKNGFLHISDLQPQYFPGGMKTVEEVGRKTPRRDRPPIQKCLRRGQEIIVQIIKEGIGTKGPTLTTYISIPGRYLVMMPGMNRLGVSRRIEDDDARRKMRSVLDELNLPKEMGFILRTAGLDRNKRELQGDLLYLQRLWKVVARRIKGEKAPCELYRESDLVIRTIRDVFSSDFARIIVDDPRTADKVKDFLAIAMPRSSAPVDLYGGHRPLFHEYKLEQEIERINSRYVPLPSGGSLVIESTEALVAIDVNSGKYREHDDAEETAYRINLEAAEEIARQLRLRDLGGLILCDFIDMRLEKHRRGVERALRDALKKHKERAKCLRMSQFGIIEMTRQRMRPSIKRSIYRDCPNCRGTGLVKNSESMTLDIMRLLRLASHHDQVDTVEIRVSPDVAFQIQNRKRAALHALERETGRQIVIRADENLGPDQYAFECLDKRGGMIRMDDLPDASRSIAEPRSRRRGGPGHGKPPENGRETLEDVFD